MTSVVTYKIIDFSGEYSSVAFNISPIDEETWVAVDLQVLALQTAIAALTAGNVAQRSLTAYTVPVNDTYPTEQYAQRETGLRLFYKDNVNGKKFHVTIPAPDLALIAEEGSDMVDMSNSIVGALVAAMEAVVVSPYGNGVTFYRGAIIGRRN